MRDVSYGLEAATTLLAAGVGSRSQNVSEATVARSVCRSQRGQDSSSPGTVLLCLLWRAARLGTPTSHTPQTARIGGVWRYKATCAYALLHLGSNTANQSWRAHDRSQDSRGQHSSSGAYNFWTDTASRKDFTHRPPSFEDQRRFEKDKHQRTYTPLGKRY